MPPRAAAALLFSIAGIPAANAAEVAQAGVLPPPEAAPGRGGGAGGAIPSLPEIAPAPQPAPELPPRPPQPAPAPLSEAPRFVLRDVKIEGNTVLDEQAIRKIVSPYIGKLVSIADLEEIRRQLSLLYINRGFINSGATIPDQNVENGVVTFRFVEGRVTDIEVTGTEHFDPEYFRSRLALAATSPFNVENMQQEQQILLQDPLVKRLNIELQPRLVPGEARLMPMCLKGPAFRSAPPSPMINRRRSAGCAARLPAPWPISSVTTTSWRPSTDAARASTTGLSAIRRRSPATTPA
jgi:hypothetical protein